MSYILGSREFMDQTYLDITRKMDDLVYSSFRSLGYTRDWIFRNLDRITIDHMPNPPYTDHVVYKLDGSPIFSINQKTEAQSENGVYNFKVDLEVQFFFKKGEN